MPDDHIQRPRGGMGVTVVWGGCLHRTAAGSTAGVAAPPPRVAAGPPSTCAQWTQEGTHTSGRHPVGARNGHGSWPLLG